MIDRRRQRLAPPVAQAPRNPAQRRDAAPIGALLAPLRHDRLFAWGVGLALLLSLGDALTTWLALRVGAGEGNPLMQALFACVGVPLGLTLKLVGAVLVALALVLLYPRWPVLLRISIWLFSAWIAFTDLNNLAALLITARQ